MYLYFDYYTRVVHSQYVPSILLLTEPSVVICLNRCTYLPPYRQPLSITKIINLTVHLIVISKYYATQRKRKLKVIETNKIIIDIEDCETMAKGHNVTENSSPEALIN